MHAFKEMRKLGMAKLFACISTPRMFLMPTSVASLSVNVPDFIYFQSRTNPIGDGNQSSLLGIFCISDWLQQCLIPSDSFDLETCGLGRLQIDTDGTQ